MPLYTYSCEQHGEFDIALSLKEDTQSFPCLKCQNPSKKVIVLGSGGIMRTGDSLPWVRDAAQILTGGNKKMETIDDYRSYLKSHPNVLPMESHPCIPSSYGDCKRPDPVQEKKDRSKKAHEKIRNMRSITVA